MVYNLDNLLKSKSLKACSLIILTLVISSFKFYASSQTRNLDSIPLYFPKTAFGSHGSFDTNSNRYWSSYLFGLKKEIIYNNKSVQECYRIIYYGSNPFVLEIFKRNDKYIFISDSIDNRVWCRRYDSMNIAEFARRNPELSRLDNYFWNMKNHNYYKNTADNLYFMIDDRDNWLIEIKKGDNYNVITRIQPEKAIIELVTQLMATSKHSGYRIYTSNDSYDEF
jgi:hypothetical protein